MSSSIFNVSDNLPLPILTHCEILSYLPYTMYGPRALKGKTWYWCIAFLDVEDVLLCRWMCYCACGHLRTLHFWLSCWHLSFLVITMISLWLLSLPVLCVNVLWNKYEYECDWKINIISGGKSQLKSGNQTCILSFLCGRETETVPRFYKQDTLSIFLFLIFWNRIDINQGKITVLYLIYTLKL